MTDYTEVTELGGAQVSFEQVERLCHRYYWAGEYCHGKDVLEAACGTGQGLGYLAGRARSVVGGDVSQPMLRAAHDHYRARVPLCGFDAGAACFADASFDVIVLFEALYYLPAAGDFIAECRRLLRPGGTALIASANKDLYDFNPSPYSHRYYGVAELAELLRGAGFEVACFGVTRLDRLPLRQRLLRPIKKLVVSSGLMPKSMAGKRLMKRLVFGRLIEMPVEIAAGQVPYTAPEPIPADRPNTSHKVIYCAARVC